MKKKVVLIIVLAFVFSLAAFASFEVLIQYTKNSRVNNPTQNEDGSWNTNLGGEKYPPIILGDDEDPYDPKTYEERGGMPTKTETTLYSETITIPGDEPVSPSGDDPKKVAADLNDEAQGNSEDASSNSINSTETIDDTIKAQDAKTGDAISQSEASASAPIGDPVLLSTGAYIFDEVDMLVSFQGLEFPLSRHYQSEKTLSGAMKSLWYLSLDSRILRCEKNEAENELGKLQKLEKKTKDLLENSKKGYAKLKKFYESNVNESEIKIEKYNEQKETLENIRKKYNLNSSSKKIIDGYYKNCLEIIEYYTNLKAICEKELAYDKQNNSQGKLVQIRNEIAFQQKELAKQEAFVVQSEKELTHCRANREYNMYAQRGDSFLDLITCGNDVIKVFDTKGSAYLYRIENLPVYNKGKNHYPNGSKTTAMNPGDTKDLVLHADGSFEWKQDDGSSWFYTQYGLLEKIQNIHGIALCFNYNKDFYLTSIDGKDSEGTYPLVTFYWQNNRLVKIENARDKTDTVEYNYSGDTLSSVQDREGDLIQFSYDGILLTKITKPGENAAVVLNYGFTDGKKKLVSETKNEEGFSETFEYSKDSSYLLYTDHSGIKTEYWYDENHRTTKINHPDGTIETFSYDKDDNLIKLIKNGSTTSFTYDGKGNKRSALYSDGSSEQWSYNPFNAITFYKDRDGLESRLTYDEKNNLLLIQKGRDTLFSATYNAKGQLISSTQGSLFTQYSYDVYGNVISRKTGTSSSQRAEFWTYDGQNRILSYTNPLGEKTSYEYKEKQTIVNYPNGLERKIVYNNRKDLVSFVEKDTFTGKIIETEFVYDKRHLLLEKKIQGNRIVSYTYKPAGEIETEIFWDDEGGWKQKYVYDDSGRVKEIVQSEVDKAGKAKSNDVYKIVYSYTKNLAQEIISMTDPLNRVMSQTKDEWGRTIQTKKAEEVFLQTYSAQGRIQENQNAYGGFYSYSYDDKGLISSMSEKNGSGTLSYTYNPNGSLNTISDAKGNVSSFIYNEFGELSETQSPGKKEFYSYDSLGRIKTYCIGNTNNKASAESWLEYSYSNNGRTVSINQGDAVFSTQTKDGFGNIISITDGEGNKTEYLYNEKGQVLSIIDANNTITSYAYNALGNITHLWYADAQPENAQNLSPESLYILLQKENASLIYTYNYLGRLVSVKDCEGLTWEGRYDKAGRLIWEDGNNMSEKSYSYDEFDRITEVQSGGIVVEKYSYTDRGKKVFYIDGEGEQYSFEKDLYGKLRQETNRLGNSQSYEYEKDGSLKSTNDFSSKIKTITTDEKNRTRTITYSDGSVETITYTMTGNVKSAKSKTGIINYSYNKAGLLITQEDTNAGETTFFAYDKAGRRTRMDSGNREVFYRYGKVGELLSIVDNKQRMSVSYVYDSRYREIERQFGNGLVQKTEYTPNGKTEIIKEINARGELLRAEAYVYDEKDRRIFTVSEKGLLTSYFYDAQSRLQKVLYPYTEEKKAADKTEAQEEGIFYIEGNIKPINYFLNQKEKSALSRVLEKISYGRSNYLTTTQVQWEESYTYDCNGNRASKTTTFGTIRYWYDAENRLIHSGSDSARGSDYTYDLNGNLLSKTNLYKSEIYEYNLANRMKKSEVTDHIKKTHIISYYDYDAFGRRTLVQDENGKLIRTLYDAFSFDIIREQETFADGYFTNTRDTGIQWGKVSEGDGSRYRYISDDGPVTQTPDGYQVIASNRASSSVVLYANGKAVSQTRSSNNASTERTYFGTDLLGTVRSATRDSGTAEYYEYDVFGKPLGDNISDFAYTGKPYDPTTGMYNYGYRDYSPQTARFTTVDPIRDGSNWFVYCNNEPVNWVDMWGLAINGAVATSEMNKQECINGINQSSLNGSKQEVQLNPNKNAEVLLSYTKNSTDTLTVTVRNKNSDGTYDYSNNGVQVKTFAATNNVLSPEERGGKPVEYNGYNYFPEQFPTGTWDVSKSHTSNNPLIGPISISTNASKIMKEYDAEGKPTGETVRDDGYSIHSGTGSTTWGCIKMSDKDVAEIAHIIDMVLDNGGKAKLTILDALKNK